MVARFLKRWWIIVLFWPAGFCRAQDASLDVAGKWKVFTDETFSPLTLVSGAFNATISQAGDSDPRYGQGGGPWAQRFGASVADIGTQDFFGDFVLASAFHEDPRYFRRGPKYSFWHRAGYAISRAIIIRKDSGGHSLNWSNVIGTAMSTGLSNAYYPPPSRTGGAMALNYSTSVAGAGLGNLALEFGPDFRGWLRRHRPRATQAPAQTHP